ncbi:hypothetical protein INT47_004794 [Mucor saturninus]|uniref:Uncharacterized protein n=1 Tax=Mucor saturninus TaxID=64648 RepID=A0A8H7R390_9FUNG|nr:hypothetical protein INT47_004794 [Mucor saturninus]
MKRISSMMSRKSSKSTLNETPDSISVLLLGARGCGKTSFLYKAYFKYATDNPDTHFDVLPTPSHNVEIIPYQTQLYQLWDFAGNLK